MSDFNNEKSKYFNILNRLQKKYSIYEGLFIIKKQYLTNNSFYYFLCIFFRFIYIISISGNYTSLFGRGRRSFYSIQNYLNKLTCYNLLQQFTISYKLYFFIVLIILIFFLINLKLTSNIVKDLGKYKSTYKWPLPTKYQIIIDHLNYIFFPFIIEFLSFSYYMYFFPNKFIILYDIQNQKILLIFFMILNTFLIIVYNIDNYIDIVCSNRIYTISIYDADSDTKENSKVKLKRPIAYRCSNIFFYIIIFLQNIVIFSRIELYINFRYIFLFRIIISFIILFALLALLINQVNEFNYDNFMNKIFDILIFFCNYSLVIDGILFLTKTIMMNQKNQLFYELIKLFLSYISYLLLRMKSFNFLESKITEILFQDKNIKKEKYFLNCFFYLHEIMLKIKEKNDVESAFYLTKFLNKHINTCNKTICDCKLFDIYLNKNKNNLNKEELKNYLHELLDIINYLFECAFVEYDFYQNYDISILLAEHFCHLRTNPTMSFSVIITLMLKNANKFSKFEMVVLYELCQKYIYYIMAKVNNDLEVEIHYNKFEALKNQFRQNEFIDYYYNVTLSNKAKKLISNYIDNEMKIIKYKSIFEESLSFQFDENNESIMSVKINFFNQFINIDNLYNEYDSKKAKKNNRKKQKKIGSNLNNIIYLLRMEYKYYKKILYSISQIQISKDVPIFMIFKYILFFDIFIGGKLPENVINQLYGSLLKNNENLYSSIITESEYNILKRKYNEQNNLIGSKTYVIVEFKKELRTKYFGEDGALKLGFQQKDIINEKIDLLMPRDFCKSHQNAIKKLIIGTQVRYSISKQSYYFDKSNTILYVAYFEGSLIYNISKSLIMMLESFFNYENYYRFMLNNNFELLACTRNFEDEYFLNQKILQSYNIKFLDILKIKPEKLNQKFENELKFIQHQKYIRQIKPEEYFIPGFYITPEDKIVSIVNQNYFGSSKNNILSKISISNNKSENINYHEDNDDEEKKLIEKEKINNSLSDILINSATVVFHKTYNVSLNKGNFIQNLAKELIKIPENDLMFENDKTSYNLIKSSKQLISKLLTKSELSTHLMRMTIKFSFYYDKPFYFITIDDEKKAYLNISKNINFQNNHKKQDKSLTSKTKNMIPRNKSIKQTRNKNIMNMGSLPEEKRNNKEKNKPNNDKISNDGGNDDKNKILNIVKEYRTKINKDRFISIIKFILSVIIICILVINLFITEFQKSLAEIMEDNVLAYYYNLYTRDLVIGVQSALLYIYFDKQFFGANLQNDIINRYILGNLTTQLKEKYHNFTEFFFEYNLDINHDFNLIYKKEEFVKLRGFWQRYTFLSKYSSEIDFIIYNIFSSLSLDLNSDEIKKDFDNFLFLKGQTKIREKINTPFIKVLYYLCLNYELVYRDLFTRISDSIYDSYKTYVNKNINYYIFLEIFALLLYIFFFVTAIIFLYYSNNIIIKNIIFLFLDFSEKHYEKNKSNNNNLIKYKLIEFQYIIDDFDISLFERFTKKLDNINKNKYVHTNSYLNQSKTFKINSNLNQNDTNKLPSNRESFKKLSSKKSDKTLNTLEEGNNLNGKNSLFSEMKNRGMNNSSQNYIELNNSQSKDKISNNSFFNASKDLLINNSKDYTNNKNVNAMDNNSFRNNDIKNVESLDQENYQDILLNRSNKALVLMIKIYLIIIIILTILITAFILFKFKYILSFNRKYNRFFKNMSILTNRYAFMYYYFNTMRLVIVLPERNKYLKMYEDAMEDLNERFEAENKEFLEILSSGIEDYGEINKLFNILKETKGDSDSFENIKRTICDKNPLCGVYLESNRNLLHSGVDFASKTIITEISNIYMDYKKIIHKEEIKELNSTLFYSKDSQFINIGKILNFFFLNVEEKIFDCLEKDEINLNSTYIQMMNFLNLFSIIISIFIFLFIIFFIFISINNFSEPIKESSYRINCSFLHIKKYSLTTYRKADSSLFKY